MTLPEVPLPAMGEQDRFIGLYGKQSPLVAEQLAENLRQSRLIEAIAYGRTPRKGKAK